jgi:hypothetical protein
MSRRHFLGLAVILVTLLGSDLLATGAQERTFVKESKTV